MYSQHYDVYSKHYDVYSLETSLLVTLSLKIILITTNDVKLHIQRHVLSSNLEQNDSKVSNFSKFGWQLLNFLATFGCIVKQLLLDLLAQSVHAYS